MMQYKRQIPKYWWLELLLVTVSDVELGENINSVVFGVNKKRPWWWLWSEEAAKSFFLNRPFLEIDLSAAKLFLKGSTLNHS